MNNVQRKHYYSEGYIGWSESLAALVLSRGWICEATRAAGVVTVTCLGSVRTAASVYVCACVCVGEGGGCCGWVFGGDK